MACLGCSCSTGKDADAPGCRSNGGCASGGCNRHNTYDWISAIGIRDPYQFDVVEVSFKNGSRKEFFKNPPFTKTVTGDWVIVESASGGYDVGKISLSGELVRLQMKRKRVRNDAKLQPVVRKAHERDLERLDEIRRDEKNVMIRARAIARALDLDMKVGDVEFQGDGRKCTFYYTADGRVDFRELIRQYAREFKVKIEMRQIGARQESARIGGLGNCGRELCCSTWLSEFKSVNTAAARYQNLAINQTKLSGMCGRLKCCLNYELDTYVDALEDFPDRAEKMKTSAGLAILIKTDVFKRIMYYTYAENRGKFFPLHVDQVWEALEMIKNGKLPGSLEDIQAMAPPPEEIEEEEPDFESVNDVIELPIEKKKKKKKNKNKKRDRSQSAAAAVEKAAREDAGQPQRRGAGNDQRGRGNQPQNRSGKPGGKPEQRGPQSPANKPDNRSQQPANKPQAPKEDRREQRPPQTPKNPQQGGNNQQNPAAKGPQTPRPPKPQGPKNEGSNQQPRPPQPKNEGNTPPPKNEGGNTPPNNPGQPNQNNKNKNNRRDRWKGPKKDK
jgi:cell fate regulator YaaT (PSP1 superfamily)